MRLSRWELAGESLHECFLNSHCSVKRAVRVAWELTRVFLLFSISLFLLVASPLLFLRFLTLVKLLTVRVITPTVICRWYVIIFPFFLLLLMGNDLEIACFCNSLRLSCNSHDRSNEPNVSMTLIKIWTSSKLMRVDESWRSNETARVATLIPSYPRLIRPLDLDETEFSIVTVWEKQTRWGTAFRRAQCSTMHELRPRHTGRETVSFSLKTGNRVFDCDRTGKADAMRNSLQKRTAWI